MIPVFGSSHLQCASFSTQDESDGATSMLRAAFLTGLVCAHIVFGMSGFRPASLQSSEIRQLTYTPEESFNINPCLSGDGLHIAFESTADFSGAGRGNGFHAYSASLESNPTEFVDLGATRAITSAISQNGETVVFASKDDPLGTNNDRNSEIFLFIAGQLRQITNTLPADVSLRHVHGNFQPSVSDDGGTIAFASNRQLTGQNGDGNLEVFTYDSTSNQFTQRTSTSGTVGSMDAKISGDASHVSYLIDNEEIPSLRRDLALQDLNSGVVTIVQAEVDALEVTTGRAISDDGLRVVFSSETATDSSQVFLYDGRNNITRQITSLGTRADDVPLYATISGDGKRIGFATRRNVVGGNSDNSVELYTYDLPTSHFAKITNAPSSAMAEVISSLNDDGSLIAFNFARVLSGTVSTPSLANNSELYVAQTEIRPAYSDGLMIQNGASFGYELSTTGAIAPDSIAVASGVALAFDSIDGLPTPSGSYPLMLGGTTVTINQRPAQLFSVSPTLVRFHVPAPTEATFAQVIVTNAEGYQTRGSIHIHRASPGLFTTSGNGLGEGVISDSETGQPGPFDPTLGPRHLVVQATGVRGLPQQTQIAINGRRLRLLYIEPSATIPGLDLINFELPPDTRGAGAVSLLVRSGRRESNPVELTILGDFHRNLFITEVLADPPDGISGDANHDGVRSGTEDEFVELVNAEPHEVDVSGWTVRTHTVSSTNETTRHVFAQGTVVNASDAIVIFGGGNFDPGNPVFGGSRVISTSSAGFSLTNTGLTVLLRDAAGNLITEFSYGGTTGLDGNANQSLTRSPDIFGNYLLHTLAQFSRGTPFSPGKLVDGGFFVPHEGHLTSITAEPTAIDAIVGQRIQVKARVFDQFGRPARNVDFSFNLDEPNAGLVESVRIERMAGIATATILCTNPATTMVRASAPDGTRVVTGNPTMLNVMPAPPVITRIEVSPTSQRINRGASHQFAAKAFDADNHEVTGVSFQWTSQNALVGTVHATGLAHGVGIGSTVITATASNGTGGFVSGAANLTVEIPIEINELLADVAPDNPSTPDLEGDANRDGVRNSADDEFVELVNMSPQPVDLSGVVIADMTSNRFTFPPNTILGGGRSVVVFGGGTPRVTDPAFGGSTIFVAPSLGLNDTGDTVRLKLPMDSVDIVITEILFGSGTPIPAPTNQSLTRSPDADIDQPGGEFVGHLVATNSADRIYSPGTRTDGTPIASNSIGRIEILPSAASIELGNSQLFEARAFASGAGGEVEITNVCFIWNSSDQTKAILSPATGAVTSVSTLSAGIVAIRARAGPQVATATLTINPSPQVLTSIEVVPANATIVVGATHQFVARAFDQDHMEIPGIVFTWAVSDASIATIDQAGIATGLSIGLTQIRASSGLVTSTPATLNVTIPQIPTPGQLIINEALVSFTAGTPTRTDFLELYNASAQTLDLSGLTISFRASGSTTVVSAISLPGSVGSGAVLLAPNSYYLIANGSTTFGIAADFNASTFGFDLNNSSGGIKIEISGVKLDGLKYQQNGSATPPPAFEGFGEGALFAFAGGTPNDLIRSPNATDTDNNALDFRRNNSHATVSPKAANPTLP